MNRYDGLLWAFRLFFSSGAIEEVKKWVASLETDPQSGADKRALVERSVLPAVEGVSVYLLRALIETVLAKLRA